METTLDSVAQTVSRPAYAKGLETLEAEI